MMPAVWMQSRTTQCGADQIACIQYSSLNFRDSKT